MRIQMNATAAGPEFVLKNGHVYNVGSKLGESMVKGGYAKHVPNAPKPERLPPQPDPQDTLEPDTEDFEDE